MLTISICRRNSHGLMAAHGVGWYDILMCLSNANFSCKTFVLSKKLIFDSLTGHLSLHTLGTKMTVYYSRCRSTLKTHLS